MIEEESLEYVLESINEILREVDDGIPQPSITDDKTQKLIVILQTWVEWIKTKSKEAWLRLKAFVARSQDVLEEIAQKISAKMSVAGATIQETFSSMLGYIKNMMSAAFNNATGLAKTLMDGILKAMKFASNLITRFIQWIQNLPAVSKYGISMQQWGVWAITGACLLWVLSRMFNIIKYSGREDVDLSSIDLFREEDFGLSTEPAILQNIQIGAANVANKTFMQASREAISNPNSMLWSSIKTVVVDIIGMLSVFVSLKAGKSDAAALSFGL